jgi:proteasome lid subunit RPN8/RPN11
VGPDQLVIAQHLLQRILEHCMEEKPYEACGILTGVGPQVSRAYATDNAKRSPVYYQVEESQQAQILQETAQRGEELVAIYHSHPTASAHPSQNDVRMAVHYPEAIRLIISLAGPAEVRAFRIKAGRVHDVPIVAVHEALGQWHDLRGGSSTVVTADGGDGSLG